ncbi:hypothetical protein ABZP36_014650 [Zizania latifolia]
MARTGSCLSSQLVAKGRETAALLHVLLGQQLPAGSPTLHVPVGLTKQILRCCDRVLAALHGSASTEDNDDTAGSGRKRKTERGSAGSPAAAASSKRIRCVVD